MNKVWLDEKRENQGVNNSTGLNRYLHLEYGINILSTA